MKANSNNIRIPKPAGYTSATAEELPICGVSTASAELFHRLRAFFERVEQWN